MILFHGANSQPLCTASLPASFWNNAIKCLRLDHCIVPNSWSLRWFLENLHSIPKAICTLIRWEPPNHLQVWNLWFLGYWAKSAPRYFFRHWLFCHPLHLSKGWQLKHLRESSAAGEIFAEDAPVDGLDPPGHGHPNPSAAWSICKIFHIGLAWFDDSLESCHEFSIICKIFDICVAWSWN